MTQIYSSQNGVYVLLDSDGYVVAKADVPPGDHPVPDHVDTSKTFDVDTDADLAAKLGNSPANGSASLPAPAHENARKALESVEIDDRYRDA